MQSLDPATPTPLMKGEKKKQRHGEAVRIIKTLRRETNIPLDGDLVRDHMSSRALRGWGGWNNNKKTSGPNALNRRQGVDQQWAPRHIRQSISSVLTFNPLHWQDARTSHRLSVSSPKGNLIDTTRLKINPQRRSVIFIFHFLPGSRHNTK